jgi:hypothetical protein
MEQTNLLKELIYQIKDNKLLSDRGNAARTSGINGGENNKAGANDEVTHLVPLEGTTKEDIKQMVEATAMVYKVMKEQHNVDSLVMKCVSMNWFCSYAAPMAYQNVIRMAVPLTFFR